MYTGAVKIKTSELEPNLAPNAIAVLEKRYLWKEESGRITESPRELFLRVADAIAQPEKKNRGKWKDRFAEMMISLRFLPNSPTLMNAGKKHGQLSACFVLPVEDSLDGIFETLKQAAKIHQSGGGTGFGFSRLRPSGSSVHTTHGVASGPVSFIKIFDMATETIKQGGARRGANMAILRVDHPDILEFIQAKRDQSSILNFNLSVGVTDVFMRAVREKSSYSLIHPHHRRFSGTLRADEVMEKIAQAAWECGDPGLVFLDRINLFNPTPAEGFMESTNPCGEQPLLAYESCNLGSLNVSAYFIEKTGFDWVQFRQDVHDAVRFLDNVIDVNRFPVQECAKITHKNRKIGLGVMGFADLLLLLGVPYASDEGRSWGERIMSVLDREAKRASMNLAKERGAFRGYSRSLWKRLGYPELRNATVSTVAPTGTISMIAGVSSGIEPIFSASFVRNVLSGARLQEVHPVVKRLFESEGGKIPQDMDQALRDRLGAVWSPAQDLSVRDHIRMQAVFQRHSDSAVSKTINLSESATIQDVRTAYELAYQTGCKGITVYRDRSRSSQVLDRFPPPIAPLDGESYCPSC